MDWNLKITDMAGATPEHSSVIVNFVAAVRYQLKNSTCYVYSDNVQYRFKDAEAGFFHCILVHITHNHPGKVFA